MMMKKLIPILFLGSVMSANAQVVIDQGDFPEAGDSFTFGTDDDVSNLPTLNLGTTGAGQTFDFTMLQTDSIFDVGFYVPATVDVNGNFPTADMAVDQSGAYGYVEVNASTVDVIGLGGDLGPQLGSPVPLELAIPATNPWTIFTFPSQLNTSFSDTAVFDQTVVATGLLPANVGQFWQPEPDSVRIKRTIYIESEMVGEGTLTNSLLETHDVLKMNVVEVGIDTLWGWTAANGWELPPPLVQLAVGLPSNNTTYRTRFLSSQIGYYVTEFETDASGAPISSAFISNASQCCAGVEEVVAAGEKVLYPNPTNGSIRVRTGGEIYQLEIVDMSGKLLQSTRLTYDGQEVLLDGLANGLYVYQMISEEGNVEHTGRLSRIH